MPNNGERREVAASLRKLKPKGCMRVVLGWAIVCEDVECCEDCNALAMSCLADLIDPDDMCRKCTHGEERTCRMEPTFIEPTTLDNIQEWRCSNCDGYSYTHEGGMPAICPNCGAKVVD